VLLNLSLCNIMPGFNEFAGGLLNATTGVR
jgi:hypothetical protein